jgi:xanthine dehydrogenase large subunit
VADRAVFHADNAYYLSDVEIASYRCKTNTQSHTAFRGFGGPQGVIAIEAILGDIARTWAWTRWTCACATSTARRGATSPTTRWRWRTTSCTSCCPSWSSRAVPPAPGRDCGWNARSPVLKRGIAITPVKFGISFTATLFNQAGALVHVYTDGSVQVNHGGTEMGQGLHTKVAQIVADELGVPLPACGDRQRHQQGAQRQRHRRQQRHRPERPRRPVRRAPCARQPGRLRGGWTAAAPGPSALPAGR